MFDDMYKHYFLKEGKKKKKKSENLGRKNPQMMAAYTLVMLVSTPWTNPVVRMAFRESPHSWPLIFKKNNAKNNNEIIFKVGELWKLFKASPNNYKGSSINDEIKGGKAKSLMMLRSEK